MTKYAEIAVELINELHTARLQYESEYMPLIEAANRLFEYEDIGFSPEELKEMVAKQKWHIVADEGLPKADTEILVTVLWPNGGKSVNKAVYLLKHTHNAKDLWDTWEFEQNSEAIEYDKDEDECYAKEGFYGMGDGLGYRLYGESGYEKVIAWRELPEPWEGVEK